MKTTIRETFTVTLGNVTGFGSKNSPQQKGDEILNELRRG